jgi:hypothetical protein
MGVGVGVGNAVGTAPDATNATKLPGGHVPGAGGVGSPSNVTPGNGTITKPPQGGTRTATSNVPVALTHSNVPAGNVVPPGPPSRSAVSDRSRTAPEGHTAGIGVGVGVGVTIGVGVTTIVLCTFLLWSANPHG